MDEETKKNTSEMRKKGLALASAALIGAASTAFTSSSINKYKENAINATNKVVAGTSGDDWYDDYTEQKPVYIDSSRYIKTYEDEDYPEYLRVFTASSSAQKYGLNSKYEFKIPEYSTSYYVPREDVALYTALKVNVDLPSAECSNLRMTPEFTSGNIIRKIPKDGLIYIKPGAVQMTEDYTWYKAIYDDNGTIIEGFFCDMNDEYDKKYTEFTLDRYSYSYVDVPTRLYTTDEMCNMYYEVTEENGISFTRAPGEYEDSVFIPQGTIIKGTANTVVKKSSLEDNYAWMQCILNDDGEPKLGYIPYRTKGKELVRRVPAEKLEQEITRQK